jgi:Holliday junction resolvasome RuvABC endonuclease subunit
MAGNILALDLSLRTGWAAGRSGVIQFGTHDLSAYKDDWCKLDQMLFEFIRGKQSEHDITHFVIEAPFFHPKHPSTARLLHGLAWSAHLAASRLGLPRGEYSPTELKRATTGQGFAKKEHMVMAMQDKGYDVIDHNAADAIALLLLHESRLTPPP